MEFSLEIVVWFMISFMVGILVFSFVIGIDYNQLFETMKGNLDNEDNSLKKLDLNNFVLESLYVWKSCGFGEVSKNKTLFYNSTDLTEVLYVQEIMDLNLCNVISAGTEECGGNDSVDEIDVDSITGPKIILVSCDPVNRILKISE